MFMNGMGRSIMVCFPVVVVFLFVISIPSVLTAGPQDYICHEPFVVEATQLVSSQACPATIDELNQLRQGALLALQETANSECLAAQDVAGNRCPTAVLLGREAKSAVNCAAVELAIPGVPGQGIVGSTISLTISGSFACQ